MDPEKALHLVKNGATLLLLNVHQYTLNGVDTQMFSFGPNFKGIKMILPGIHFIYYSSSNRDGSAFSPIVGFFIDASPSEDQKEERFVKLLEEEEERYANAVRTLEFDKQIGPYTLSHYQDWKCLSRYITNDAIERIAPLGGEITIISESQTVKKFGWTAMDEALANQLKHDKFPTPEEKFERRGCYYTSIPRVAKHKGMSAKELTSLNLDKTQILESVLVKEYRGDESALLEELQFAHRLLLENTFGWQFQQNSASGIIYFEEDDEYAPVVEILDD